MKILNLVQGSDEWKAARLKHCCASEAPAMMNVGWMTRNQLLDLKKGAAQEPINDFKQALFDKGHAAEASAREILELDHCEDFPAVTGIKTVEGVDLLASFDGLEGGVIGQTSWEHKLWNVTLAANVKNSTLEPKYYWQLEHQILVNGGNDCIFTCSDGTNENKVSMMYFSKPERRKELIAGWKQFLKDLEVHEIKAKQEVIVAQKTTLPALTWSVNGSEITTNIGICLEQVKELAEIEMSKVLDSDQDFADKDQLNKDVKNARERLKTTLLDVEGMFVCYSEFASVAKEMDAVLQKMQSAGEKQVKQAKEAKKNTIEDNGRGEIWSYVEAGNKKIAPMLLDNMVSDIRPDLKIAMKGKRTIESLEAAVDAEVVKVKSTIDQAMELIVPNLAYLRKHAEDYKFLFTDAQSLVNQPEESFQAIVKSRIAEHKEAEAKRLQAEAERLAEAAREKIRKEEEKKAADKVKDEAEAKAKKDREEAKELAVKATKETNERIADKIIDQAVEPEEVYLMPETIGSRLSAWSEKHDVSLEAMAELHVIINEFK